MIAERVHVKGVACFKNQWAGIDEFKPITVIIGRNNSGKSHLLDIIEQLTGERVALLGCSIQCTGQLDEESLRAVFGDQKGGDLPGHNTHWLDHGQEFLGRAITWEENGTGSKIVDVEYPTRFRNANKGRERRLVKIVESAIAPIHNLTFRRLLADRDVISEAATKELSLAPDGAGATNIIRRFIVASASEMKEEIVQVQLRNALSQIFGDDGEFTHIEVRHHEDDDKWEVFLGEPKKGLIPLSSSGSGLKTVVLVLLNLLVIPEMDGTEKGNFLFAFEELENNLHPALLRRLFHFLAEYVERERCSLFLTTHSNIALDFFATRSDSQIICVSHDGESASTKTVHAHFDQVQLLTELGAKPSDLLQANGVVWLEGPSDRFYFNRLAEIYSDGELREGRDYQCAFYGGAVLAKTQFSDPDNENEDLANLLRLNHNAIVICDGDKTSSTSRIKGRVKRIKKEVERVPNAVIWITDAKEIENYIPGKVWDNVFEKSGTPDPSQYDSFPTSKLDDTNFVKKHLKRKSFDKCDFAMKAVEHINKDNLSQRFEIKAKMLEIIGKIREWNQ